MVENLDDLYDLDKDLQDENLDELDGDYIDDLDDECGCGCGCGYDDDDYSYESDEEEDFYE